MNLFKFFWRLWEYRLKKKFEATTIQLLDQSPGKFLCSMWNLVKKTYPKIVTLRLFFKIFKRISKNVKKNWKNSYGFGKLINLFEIKIRIIYETLPIFFWQFVDNFAALSLCKIFFWHLWYCWFFQTFLLYREVLKFWLSQTFSRECIGKEFLKQKFKLLKPICHFWPSYV